MPSEACDDIVLVLHDYYDYGYYYYINIIITTIIDVTISWAIVFAMLVTCRTPRNDNQEACSGIVGRLSWGTRQLVGVPHPQRTNLTVDFSSTEFVLDN